MKTIKWMFALVCAFVLAACSSNTPTDVAKKAMQCVADGKYEQYVDLVYMKPELSSDEVKQQKQGLLGLLQTFGAQNGDKMKSMEVVSEEISEDGETAIVKMNVVYESGKEKTETTHLRKDADGDWKIDMRK